MTFDTVSGKWLVKNFSDNDCYASFETNFEEANAVKIASGAAQVVVDNEYLAMECFKHNTMFVKGDGEVEVQQLCYNTV